MYELFGSARSINTIWLHAAFRDVAIERILPLNKSLLAMPTQIHDDVP
jgi:hypothetical protein